jgi:hypothetical protein
MATSCQSFQQRKVEDQRQLLNDSIAYYSRQIQNIIGVIQQSGSTTEATQKSLLHDIDSLDRCMKDMILRFGERNRDNDLGREILNNFQK